MSIFYETANEGMEGLEGGATWGAVFNAKESQEITMQSDKTLTRVDFALYKANGTPSDNILLNIYSGGTTPENGTLVAGPFTVSMSVLVPAPGAWVPFLISPSLSLSNGTTYYFTLTRSGALDAPNSPGMNYSSDSVFAYSNRWLGNWTEAANGEEGIRLYDDQDTPVVTGSFLLNFI